MLAGIISGLNLSDTEEMKEVAIKALRDAIPFIAPLFADPKVANFTIEAIMSTTQTPDLVELSIQALIEFVKSNYDQVGLFLEKIQAFTYPVMQTDTK